MKVAGRAAVIAVGLTVAPVVMSVPVTAHPFGPPLTAVATVEDAALEIRVLAAEDDWVILGDHLGVFADPAGAALLTMTEPAWQLGAGDRAVMSSLPVDVATVLLVVVLLVAGTVTRLGGQRPAGRVTSEG